LLQLGLESVTGTVLVFIKKGIVVEVVIDKAETAESKAVEGLAMLKARVRDLVFESRVYGRRSRGLVGRLSKADELIGLGKIAENLSGLFQGIAEEEIVKSGAKGLADGNVVIEALGMSVEPGALIDRAF
jgi:hypothetical protein